MSTRDLVHYALMALVPVAAAAIVAFGPVAEAPPELATPGPAAGQVGCGSSEAT